MGLDNYWAKQGMSDYEKLYFQPLKFDPPLCFGEDMLSGYDYRGFRGKQFEKVIWQITRITLFSEWLSPRAVRRVARRLEKYVAKPRKLRPSEEDGRPGWECWELHELADVARMFRAYGDAGFGLWVSW